MPKVSVVTGSTAYPPGELTRQFYITVLPLSIICEGQSYRDGLDIEPDESYERP